MKIAVIGAGGVGGYFGARLAQAGHEPDLQPCVAVWQRTMLKAQGKADRVLDTLSAECF